MISLINRARNCIHKQTEESKIINVVSGDGGRWGDDRGNMGGKWIDGGKVGGGGRLHGGKKRIWERKESS